MAATAEFSLKLNNVFTSDISECCSFILDTDEYYSKTSIFWPSYLLSLVLCYTFKWCISRFLKPSISQICRWIPTNKVICIDRWKSVNLIVPFFHPFSEFNYTHISENKCQNIVLINIFQIPKSLYELNKNCRNYEEI